MMTIILLVGFALIALGLMMASAKPMPRTFRYTTMDPNRSKITFLVYSDSAPDANTSALRALAGQNQKIIKIEELDSEDYSVIQILYQHEEQHSVKVQHLDPPY